MKSAELPTFYFVCKSLERKWPEILRGEIPEIKDIHHKINSNEDAWILLSYLILKNKGMNVFITDKAVANNICIFSNDHHLRKFDCLSILDKTYDTYVVSCQADMNYSHLADKVIVHNKHQIRSNQKDIYLNLWIQPFLTPRDPSRGSKIENLTFKGHINNLNKDYLSSDFIQEIKKLSIKFDTNTILREGDICKFNDYTNEDILLAVRNEAYEQLHNKPAMKLINAWKAGVPALLGPESAYRDLKTSELDYIEVNSVSEVIDAIRKLKDNPNLYLDMIQNGRERAKSFSDDISAERWRNFLENDVYPDYLRWRQLTIQKKILIYSLKATKEMLAKIKGKLYHWFY